MATSVETIKISQMPTIMAVPVSSEVPIIVGGTNFRATVQSILKNVNKVTVGLGNVENIAPSDMPVSTAQQQALDTKLDKTASIPMSQVTGLNAQIQYLQTMDIEVSRIPQFDAEVQRMINAQPAVQFPVVQGAHTW